MLKILVATVQNFVSPATKHPWFVHNWKHQWEDPKQNKDRQVQVSFMPYNRGRSSFCAWEI